MGGDATIERQSFGGGGGESKRKSDRTSACWSASSGPGLPGTSLFLSSFNLSVGTAVQMQLTYITNSEFFHLSHPHPHQLPPSSPCAHKQQPDEITEPFLSPRSENSIVCDASEL